MVFRHVLNWTYSKAQAELSSHRVSKFYEFPKRRFQVSYSPELAESREEIDLPHGKSITVTADNFGSANKDGVIFYRRPTTYWADHEIAHLYHFNYNESQQHEAKVREEIQQKILEGQELETEDYLRMGMFSTITNEAVAYGFSDRSKPDFFHGTKFKWENNNQLSPGEFLEKQLDYLLKHMDKPLNSIAEFFDFDELPKDMDKEQLAAISTRKSVTAYQIGKHAGPLFLVEKDVKPKVEEKVTISPDLNNTTYGFHITYPLVPIPDRQRILNSIFRMDVIDLLQSCMSIHAEMLDPFMMEGYKLLAEKVEKVKP